MKKVTASLFLAALLTVAAPALAAPDPLPAGPGFNVHLTLPEEDLAAIESAGIHLIRKDFPWTAIEKTKGDYDFSKFDSQLDALDKHHIRPIFILDYANPLYPRPENTDEGRIAYANWAAAAAKHFKGRGVIWEIWNEPNVGFWKGAGKSNSPAFADQYVALVKATVPAIRAADPDCCILAGAVSCLWKDSFQWLDQTFKDGLLAAGISALSVHPYGFSRPELCGDIDQPGTVEPSGYPTLFKKLAAVQPEKSLPVLDSEVGFPTSKKVTPDQQAMLFVRQFAIDQMNHIPLTIWYNWDEQDAKNFRVRPKPNDLPPIYTACKTMTAELTGFHFTERLNVGSKLDYILTFENDKKEKRILAWTVPEHRDDPQDKTAEHDLTIPITGNPTLRQLDRTTLIPNTANPQLLVRLTPSPIYIELEK